MPKLIMATATLLLGRSSSALGVANGHTTERAAMHARTRSRHATRRLRAGGLLRLVQEQKL
jgi:hypothetical protein